MNFSASIIVSLYLQHLTQQGTLYIFVDSTDHKLKTMKYNFMFQLNSIKWNKINKCNVRASENFKEDNMFRADN